MLFGDDETFWSLLFIAGALFFFIAVPAMAILAWRSTRRQQAEIVRLQSHLHTLERRIEAAVSGRAVPSTEQAAPAPEPDMPAATSKIDQDTIAVPPEPTSEVSSEQSTEQPVEAPVAAPAEPAIAEPAIAARMKDDQSPTAGGFEQRLGARGFVWIGGLSLALAGAFLVKYSVDEGLLSPATRVALGGLLGLGLLFAGEWMRRRSGTIAQALVAAGVGDLFACLFAAVALYDLIPSPIDFGLLVLLTFSGIALALRHGPFVGLIGLAGGFLTPALVQSDQPKPTVLFVFLFFLALGSCLLWRRRRWWCVAGLGLAGCLLWTFVVAEWGRVSADGIRLGEVQVPVFLIALSGLMVWTFFGRAGSDPVNDGLSRTERWIARGGIIIAAGLMALWLIDGTYSLTDWVMLIVLTGLHLLAGRRFARHEITGYIVAALTLLAYATMPLETRPVGSISMIDLFDRIIVVGIALGILMTLGGYALAFGAFRPVRWSALSVFSSAALFAILYIDFNHRDLLFTWPVICALLALLHMIGAERLMRRWGDQIVYKGCFALHCLAVLGFIAAAIPLLVGTGWVAVIWSLLLLATIWISERLDEAWLRRATWVAVPGILIVLFMSGFPVGEQPVFNWLLYGIGVPFLSFGMSSRLLRRLPPERRRPDDGKLILLVDLATAFLGFLLVSLEIRQLFHGSAVLTASFGLSEVASLAILWLAAAYLLTRLAERRREPKLIWAALLLAGLGAAAVIAGPLLLLNPLVIPIEIGASPIFNHGLYAFILPAICLLAVARAFDKTVLHERIYDPRDVMIINGCRQIIGGVALVVGFVGASILNRQLFTGSVVAWAQGDPFSDVTGDAELYGYSVAWLLYGGGLIVAAVMAASRPLRHAAAGIILLAVLKVFLVDAAGLTGLYRVASFLGLGLSLVALGYLYQRLLLRR